MFKKLDKLIIKTFIPPFIATFFVTELVLLMQFFWLWVDDFVGKGVSTQILLKFIWYQSAALVPLALPLAVLLSSIMTFGTLGERYELVAIKSAGISLLRFMRSLFVVTILICGVAFLFSNYIIPVANLKSRTLLGDIANAQPAFDLKEGVFYDKIPGFAIKVGKKENDSIVKNIVIYEQNNALQDNFIIASDGVMRASEDKRYLEFHLRNGWRYEERGDNPSNTQYIRMGFKEYVRQFDISSLGLQQLTADSVNRNQSKVLSMRQLNVAIDSVKKVRAKTIKNTSDIPFLGSPLAHYLDTNEIAKPFSTTAKKFDAFIPDSLKVMVNQQMSNRISSAKMTNEGLLDVYNQQQNSLKDYLIEWHRKLALSFACLVLFLIGAPLGSIIRRGGLGSPIIGAIAFFMLFYFTSNTGEKFARQSKMSPFIGMWLSTFVLTPIGIFLIYKARKDSQLFNKEFYYRFWKKLGLLRKQKA